MPSYPKGTRQWAEARLAKLFEIGPESEAFERTMDEFLSLREGLDGGVFPEGTPTYSADELEAAGQGRLFA
ncbi:MAG: hypothetical protein E6Q97_02195 [Desulfurellales bacterium]|nr:MAG: hypothetical protein E6Q97_02195 [Desulfurellales bacterium]